MIQQLTVADIEEYLLKIREHEQKIAAAKEKRDQSIAYFRQLIANAQTIFNEETADDQNQIATLSSVLEQYFNENPPVGRKSHKFAGGSFGYNKSRTKYFFNGNELNADNPDLIRYAAEHAPQFVRYKEFVDWAEFKRTLNDDDPDHVYRTDTGEIIDGLRAKKGFYVKTA